MIRQKQVRLLNLALGKLIAQRLIGKPRFPETKNSGGLLIQPVQSG
jgi:hypothetical protein